MNSYRVKLLDGRVFSIDAAGRDAARDQVVQEESGVARSDIKGVILTGRDVESNKKRKQRREAA